MSEVALDNLETRLAADIDRKTKPPGSLGLLEEIALRLGVIQKALRPQICRPTIVVFAADHGLAQAGVSPYPQVVTRCKELVRSDSKNIEAWELLANAWWAMGRKPMALQAMESLLRINPDYPIDSAPIGKILEKNRDR